MRPTIVLATVGVLAIGFAVYSAASFGTAAATEHSIEIGNFYFCTQADQGAVCETDVTSGDSVTWTVVDGSHTVTQCTDETFSSCGDFGFDSGTLQESDTYARTLNTVGTYYYHCTFHDGQMEGKIVVAGVTASPTPFATASPTASPTAAPALPKTGGAPADGGVSLWLYAVLALGGLLLAGSAVSFPLARKR